MDASADAAGRALGVIVAELGFSDQLYFSKRFRGHIGYVPNACRQHRSLPWG